MIIILFLTNRTFLDVTKIYNQRESVLDFPGGPGFKNLPANAGNMGSIPGPGRFHIPWGK